MVVFLVRQSFFLTKIWQKYIIEWSNELKVFVHLQASPRYLFHWISEADSRENFICLISEHECAEQISVQGDLFQSLINKFSFPSEPINVKMSPMSFFRLWNKYRDTWRVHSSVHSASDTVHGPEVNACYQNWVSQAEKKRKSIYKFNILKFKNLRFSWYQYKK